jgi:hypothetical protein
MEESQAPGLRWRTTRSGKTPIWRASKAAIKANYPVKTVNLAPFAHNERLLVQRCQRLQAEMLDWIAGRRERPMLFDGTFAYCCASTSATLRVHITLSNHHRVIPMTCTAACSRRRSVRVA